MRALYLKLLRDYFAAKAMAALLPIKFQRDSDLSDMGVLKAELAYKMADKMMVARSKKWL